MRIVFVTSPFPGVHRVGVEGSALGLWNLVNIENVDRIRIPPADIYILGAWQPGLYDQLLGALDGTVGTLWTSSLGEMEFEPVEQDYLRRILGEDRIRFIWFGDESLAKLYPTKGFYAPYPIKVEMQPVAAKENIVTLFCPATLKKNLLSQICAVALLQHEAELILHTNVPIDPSFANSIGLKYVQHEWLERPAYLDILSKARLNFAVSWAETFNYQVADSIMLGTPSVVSAAISWIQEGWTQDRVVVNPNNPVEIAQMAARILENQEDHLSTQRRDLEQIALLSTEIRNKLLES